MSEREKVQDAIVAHLEDHRAYWNAPYGTIAGLGTLPSGGKVRNVTFGVARFLDAHATIWSPTRIVVEAEGPLASRIEGEYASARSLLAKLGEMDGSYHYNEDAGEFEPPWDPS